MSAWYVRSFGKDYLTVYQHRNLENAYDEVKQMADWLQLPQDAEILDLCCGMGRHSLALSDLGYRVTGMDLSTELLEEAKKLDNKGAVHWVHGDMRRIPMEKSFDAVVNLFTSFGYFDSDQENLKVIMEIDRMLKENGKFIIDFLNPNYVAHHLVSYSERTSGDVRIEERRSISDGYVRKRITLTEEGKPEREYMEQVRLYGLPDFETMLSQTHLKIEHVYGSYDQSSYDVDLSPRLILVGQKGTLDS